tara:strand:+ start:547 stop:705 length:159 start_codon:yes stop_codon:yes gene_type:complete
VDKVVDSAISKKTFCGQTQFGNGLASNKKTYQQIDEKTLNSDILNSYTFFNL